MFLKSLFFDKNREQLSELKHPIYYYIYPSNIDNNATTFR